MTFADFGPGNASVFAAIEDIASLEDCDDLLAYSVFDDTGTELPPSLTEFCEDTYVPASAGDVGSFDIIY